MSSPNSRSARQERGRPFRAVPVALAQSVAAERERWALWLPVLFGCGIAGYFALPWEPAPGATVGAMAVLAPAIAVAQWRGWMRRALLLLILGAPLLGIAVGSLHSWAKAAPVLERSLSPRALSNVVTVVEPFADGARIRLERLRGDRLWTAETTPRAV